jgi:hypothetical protein
MGWSDREPVILRPGDALTDGLPLSRCSCRLPVGAFGRGAVHAFYPSADWYKRRMWAATALVADWNRRGQMPEAERRALEARVYALFHNDAGRTVRRHVATRVRFLSRAVKRADGSAATMLLGVEPGADMYQTETVGLIVYARHLAEQRQLVVLGQCPEARRRAELDATTARLDADDRGGFIDGEW